MPIDFKKRLDDLRGGIAYTRIPAGVTFSTVLPDMDFETYSEAGLRYDPVTKKWSGVMPSAKGIAAVGAAVYSEHPSTEVLSLSYNLKDGKGPRLWLPDTYLPMDLFKHIFEGGLIEAWNSSFEYYIWTNVCIRKYGFPPLPFTQLRDAMVKSRAFSVPGKLEESAKVLKVTNQKINDGKRLIDKFSVPKNPTKTKEALRILPADDWPDFVNMLNYNLGDIKAESDVSAVLPDLIESELELWLIDQSINYRGVHIDKKAVEDCISIVDQAMQKYAPKLIEITEGAVKSPAELKKIVDWLATQGVETDSLDAESMEYLLKKPDLPEKARQVLEIRESLGASSVKKLYSILCRICKDGRIRDLFAFLGADRTGRWAGRGPQPQNLPSSGPKLKECPNKHFYNKKLSECPMCKVSLYTDSEWGIEPLEFALQILASRNIEYVEMFFEDAIEVISGCLRGMFMADPLKEFICSDYSAIEAVVLACLAEEKWRIDVFKTHGKIYEMSASKISGVPFEEFLRHKKETGDHHPLRKKLGKIAELASGYQGSWSAWCVFGADKYLSEEEGREAVKAWRRESPAIVNFWYGLERIVVSAIQNPGTCYAYKSITYGVKDDVLYCRLPSGRTLTYHEPRLTPGTTPWGKSVMRISYMGYDSTAKNGPKGWCRIETYGGRLTENVVQAVARDILANAIVNLEKAGYPIVLHVHDEIISEVPIGHGSIEEFEKIMATLPEWCKDWPLKAAGGWRGKRYRKE